LPDELKQNLVDSIEREMNWVFKSMMSDE
jgi:hypothetical protein